MPFKPSDPGAAAMHAAPADPFDLWLSRGLHGLYSAVASEPIPQELLRLIDGLSEREEARATGPPPSREPWSTGRRQGFEQRVRERAYFLWLERGAPGAASGGGIGAGPGHSRRSERQAMAKGREGRDGPDRSHRGEPATGWRRAARTEGAAPWLPQSGGARSGLPQSGVPGSQDARQGAPHRLTGPCIASLPRLPPLEIAEGARGELPSPRPCLRPPSPHARAAGSLRPLTVGPRHFQPHHHPVVVEVRFGAAPIDRPLPYRGLQRQLRRSRCREKSQGEGDAVVAGHRLRAHFSIIASGRSAREPWEVVKATGSLAGKVCSTPDSTCASEVFSGWSAPCFGLVLVAMVEGSLSSLAMGTRGRGGVRGDVAGRPDRSG